MSKTLHNQKYKCPLCKKKWIHEEWSEETEIQECICDPCSEETGDFSFSISFSPSWKKYEKSIWHEDTKTSQESTDKFIEEREHEIKTDPKAARWEKSRKATWDKDKPAWRKWATKRGIL